MRDALDQYRQQRNREVEKECVASLDARNPIVRGAVKPEKADHYGIGHLSGEIDTLCVGALRSRIWVIETKDPYTPYSARQTRRKVDEFLGAGKYVDTLLTKVEDVKTCATAVAAAVKAPDPDRSWNVTGLMVTRHLDPAAFAVQPKVAFCVLAEVADIVDQDDLPGPGMHSRPPR